MKKRISPLFIFFLVLTVQSFAQVTMTQATFPRGTTFIDSLIEPVQTTASLPTEGAAQTWDYSSWVASNTFTYPHVDATSDPIFVNALNSYASNLSFAGFFISSRRYETVDNSGWYIIGRTIDPITYSLAAISGGATDSLHFSAYNDIYNGRTDLMTFPATYQTQWNQTRDEKVPFELTVAAFGLNKTPGFRKRIIARDQEVVGYGTLTMPTQAGTASAPFDVLLVKVIRTRTDSFFLNGSPAPAALLGAFNLTQGLVIQDSFYNFYAPNYGANLLGMADNGGTGNVLFYRTQAIDAILSITNIQVNESNCFPNPVQIAQTLTIKTNKNIHAANLSIVDVSGRVVFQKTLEAINDNQYQWKLPHSLGKGIYFYQLEDEITKRKTQGQFQVN